MRSHTHNKAAGQSPALVSVLPAARTMRAGGADLSAVEQRLIADFRRMSEKSRTSISQFSNVIADKDVEKARKAAPALRLVVGGAR